MLLLLLPGGAHCGAPAPTVERPREDRSTLDRLLKERGELRGKLREADAAMVSHCEVTAGDCLIQAQERRTSLTKRGAFAACKRTAKDADAEQTCEDEALIQIGRLPALTDYYRFENWCTTKLGDCVEGLEEERAAAVHKARVVRRTQEIVSTKDATALIVAVEVAAARVKYLRTTLPPGLEALCTGLAEKDACEDEVGKLQQAFERAVDEPDASYSREQARARYADFRRAEAGCFDPEYTCVLEKLESYGETSSSRVWLDKNLRVLDRRQTLQHRAPFDAGERCLAEAEARYKNMVVDRYRKYASNPVGLTRAKLHAAFLLMHEEQVSCLTRHAS